MKTLFATDFDGTLFRSDGSISSIDLDALSELRLQGAITVLATGRSPFSLNRALGGIRLPFDWQILSSGVGIVRETGEVEKSFGLCGSQVEEVRFFLDSQGFDYSLQGPFPDSHILYHGTRVPHPDHFRRQSYYSGYTRPLSAFAGSASQFVVYLETDGASEAETVIRQALGEGFQVVRTTSPLDHRTVWVEVFPPGVNKGAGLEFLAEHHGIPRSRTAALGNDWNDAHLLESAGTPFVVQGSPPGLAPEAIVVSGADHHAVRNAVEIWRGMNS